MKTKEEIEFEKKWGKVCKKCGKRKGLYLGLGGYSDGNRGPGGCDCK